MATDLVPTASDTQLDAAIAHLKSLNRHAFLQYAVSVGQYFVNHFHDGDHAAALAAGSDKQGGIQALVSRRRAELQDLDLTGRTLRKYVAATVVWQGLPEQTRAKLGIDHLERLAAVGDVVERKKLADDAATMQWTLVQVATAVRQFQKEQRGGGKKRGRKEKPKALKLAVALAAAVKKVVASRASAMALADGSRSEWVKLVQDAADDLFRLTK